MLFLRRLDEGEMVAHKRVFNREGDVKRFFFYFENVIFALPMMREHQSSLHKSMELHSNYSVKSSPSMELYRNEKKLLISKERISAALLRKEKSLKMLCEMI